MKNDNMEAIPIDEVGLMEMVGKEVLYADVKTIGFYRLQHDQDKNSFYLGDNDVGMRIYLSEGMLFSMMGEEVNSPVKPVLNIYSVTLKGKNTPY